MTDQSSTQIESQVEINIASSDQPHQQQANEPQVDSRIFSTLTKFKNDLLDRPIQYDIISILFTLSVLIGGLIGYFSKESLPSLISGIIFFVLLAAGTYLEGSKKNAYPLIFIILVFGILMVWRYSKSQSFLPAGLFAVLSLIMLLRHSYLIYLRRQQSSQ